MMWSYFHPLKAIYSKIDVFFFKDTATTEIYTLSLHDALPISFPLRRRGKPGCLPASSGGSCRESPQDRKCTRLNSSHMSISHAVFCLQTSLVSAAAFASHVWAGSSSDSRSCRTHW